MLKIIDKQDLLILLSYLLPGLTVLAGYFYSPDFPFLLLLFVVRLPEKTPESAQPEAT